MKHRCDRLHPCAKARRLWNRVASIHHVWAHIDPSMRTEKSEAWTVYENALRDYERHFAVTSEATQPSLKVPLL